VARSMSSTFGRSAAALATDAAIAIGAPAPWRARHRNVRRPPSDLDRWSRRRTLAFIVGTNACAWAAIIAGVRLALRAG
jgi:hypothetical protein